MMSVSDLWVDQVRTSHTRVVRVEVWRNGTQLVEDLPVDGGSVTIDLAETLVSSCEISVADPAYLPLADDDPLAPSGSYLKVFSGIQYPDGTEETVYCFVGPIVKCPTYAEGENFTINAVSWLQYVMDDRFTSPYSPTAGANTMTTAVALLESSLPLVNIFHTTSTATVPDGLVWEDDRMKAVSDLLGSINREVRPDRGGSLEIAAPRTPSPSAPSARTIDSGQQGVLLSGGQPALDRADRYNSVVASNADDPTIRSQAVLATGPWAYGGPFGRKTLFYSSPLLTAGTVADAAQTRLDGLGGRSRTIEVSMIPDPSLDVGDHVTITWPPRLDGVVVTEKAMIRKMVIPIGLDEMSLELQGVS